MQLFNNLREMLEDEDFGDTSIADAATRDSSIPVVKPISSNGNEEVPFQSN